LLAFLIISNIPTPQAFINHAASVVKAGGSEADLVTLARGMQIVSAVLFMMVIFWLTEAIPIPATALLPAVFFPLLQLYGWEQGNLHEFTFKNVLSNYSNPIIGLFLGCFFLAGAMQKWGMDKRATFWLLTRGKITESPQMTLLVMMYATAFLSMWISNTATVAIMIPIAIGILTSSNVDKNKSRFSTALMLGVAWSASVGGVGTLIGSPPNGIAISILRQSNLHTIGFVDWLKFGVPYVVLFIPVIWLLLLKIFPPEPEIALNHNYILQKRNQLGKITRPEISVGLVFGLAVLLWISHPFWKFLFSYQFYQKIIWVDEYLIGLLVGLILFLIPVNIKKGEFVLNWKDTKFVDWGTLILFGGGLALSDAMFKTGLAGWLATSFVSLLGTPSTLVLLIFIVLMISFLTEITSNTAVTSMMVPVVIAIAYSTGGDPIALAIGTAVAASMAFMLPVATPPNAIVYGTGYVKLTDMIKAGFILDIVGWFFTSIILFIFGHLIFKIINL
jgi:sodium-dependent dicarboxylate transporter 2/3/5